MKRILALRLSLLMILTVVGCSNDTNNGHNENDELYNKAMTILDEFKDKQEVQDFLEVYDILTKLPDDEK